MNKKLRNWKNMLLSEGSPRELSGTVSFRAFFSVSRHLCQAGGITFSQAGGITMEVITMDFWRQQKSWTKKEMPPKSWKYWTLFLFFLGLITFSLFFFEKYSTQIAIVYSLITPMSSGINSTLNEKNYWTSQWNHFRLCFLCFPFGVFSMWLFESVWCVVFFFFIFSWMVMTSHPPKPAALLYQITESWHYIS